MESGSQVCPEEHGLVEALHPLQLTGARMMSDRLEFRYRLQGRGRIISARLVGKASEVPLDSVAPGLLEGAIPSEGGRLSLLVDAVEGAPESPPLPWQVDVHLASQTLADYRAAEPLGAVAALPGGVVIRVDRLLRRPDGVVLFWEAYCAGSDLAWEGDLQSNLLAGGEKLANMTSGYGGPRVLRPTPPGVPASALDVRVQALSFYGETANRPLLWHVQQGRLHTPEDWRIELAIPTGRPAAIAPVLEVSTREMRFRLEELWLARSQTAILIRSATEGLDLFTGLTLTDDVGRAYPVRSGSGHEGQLAYQFEAIPESVGRLVLSGAGANVNLGSPVEIPLEPGGKGRVLSPFPDWAPDFGEVIEFDPAPPEYDAETQDPPTATEASPALQELRTWLTPRILPAFRLQIEPAEHDQLSPRESHLAGPPFWPASEPWPVCGQCDRPLTFIGQLRLGNKGPLHTGTDHLITFHYCLHCFAYGPDDASAYRLRRYSAPDTTPLETTPPPSIEDPGYTHWNPVPCRCSLQPTRSVPHWSDAESELTGMDLGDDPWELYLAEAQAITGAPNVESRVGGYPDWIQSANWPHCPECGERMRLVWQLDSESEAGIMWGDTGRIYIFTCPRPCSAHALALVMQSC